MKKLKKDGWEIVQALDLDGEEISMKFFRSKIPLGTEMTSVKLYYDQGDYYEPDNVRFIISWKLKE